MDINMALGIWARTPTKSSVASQPTDINMALEGTTDHGHVWPLEATWTTCIMTMDPNMVFQSSMNYRYHHGLLCLHRSPASMWPPAVAWSTDINMASGSGTDDQHPHGLWWYVNGPWTSTQALAVARPWTRTLKNEKKIKRHPTHKGQKKTPIKAENWKPQYISKRSVKQMSKQSNVRQKCLQKYHLVVLCWLYTAGYGVYPYV